MSLFLTPEQTDELTTKLRAQAHCVRCATYGGHRSWCPTVTQAVPPRPRGCMRRCYCGRPIVHSPEAIWCAEHDD